MARYTPGPKPTDLLPHPGDGYKWVSAFFDLDNTDSHYTVMFGDRRYKYRLVKE